MKTFLIEIDEDKMKIIMNSLKKDSNYDEDEELIIGMMEDVIEGGDEESIHCFNL